MQPGKFRECVGDLVVLGFSVSPWSERCRAIPGYTSLVCRKLTLTNSLLFSEGTFLIPSLLSLTAASSSLPEFERRSQGSIRGDAKKFALERAQDFIVRFGLPDEFIGVEEPESRFKEVRNFYLCSDKSPHDRCFSTSKFTIGSRILLGEPVENLKVAPDLQRKQQRKVRFRKPRVRMQFSHYYPNSCRCSRK